MTTAATHRTRLGQILADEGRSQTWLARQIGVTRSAISMYVSGLHVPKDRKKAIAEALDRDVSDVFGEIR